MSTTPCRDECLYLIRLAKRLEKSMANTDIPLERWHEKASIILGSPDLESLKGEQSLENLSLELRSEWLRYANSISSRYLKSPPHFQDVHLPSGELNKYPYDRWNKPDNMEKRATGYHIAPGGWVADHILFSSGMGAVTCLLHVIRKVFEPKPGSALHLHGIGGYFEIMELMEATHDGLFQFRIFPDQESFQQSVASANSQLLYIEPVYTQRGRLEVFDMDGFVEAWHQRQKQSPTALVLDTTFTGNRFPIDEFLAQLGPHKPRVLIQISSTLKLDQEGLEFSNAGLMSIYSTLEPVVSGIATRMRKSRATMGLGLTFEQISALDYPGFLDSGLCERHSASVFENNAILANLLEVGNDLLFIGKSHPVLDNNTLPWSIAPFVNIRLQPDTEKNDRALLTHVLAREINLRGLTFNTGSSFGFRSHRIETSIQDKHGIQTIRMAMGSRTGPSLHGVIDLLNEVSRIGTYEKLRSRYPGLAKTVRRFNQ